MSIVIFCKHIHFLIRFTFRSEIEVVIELHKRSECTRHTYVTIRRYVDINTSHKGRMNISILLRNHLRRILTQRVRSFAGIIEIRECSEIIDQFIRFNQITIASHARDDNIRREVKTFQKSIDDILTRFTRFLNDLDDILCNFLTQSRLNDVFSFADSFIIQIHIIPSLQIVKLIEHPFHQSIDISLVRFFQTKIHLCDIVKKTFEHLDGRISLL